MSTKLYTITLVRAHGKEKALSIAKRCLETSKNFGKDITFVDEADFYINQNGVMNLSKTQSKKFESVKAKRVNKTINFWNEVVNTLNKGRQNE